LKNIKQFAIGLIVAILAIYFTFRNVSFSEIIDSFSDVNFLYLIPSAILLIISFAIRGLRWIVLLSPIKKIKTSQIFSPLMIGFMGNMLPARAGEFIRAYLVAKREEVAFTGVFASIVVERIFDTFMLMILFCWLLLFNSHIFSSETKFSGMTLDDLAFKFGVLGCAGFVILSTFIYMMCFQKDLIARLVTWISKILPEGWDEKIQTLIDKFNEGLDIVKDKNALIKITLYSMAVWFLVALSYYPLYWAYDLQDKSAESVGILLVMVCIFIAAFPTPGFVGSFHLGVSVALHHIMGEDEVVALSYGMVVWALNMAVVVLIGIYYILTDHLSPGQLTKLSEQSEKEMAS
jgi:glycosyltransferase 2 family protein